jgi:hypothetical protein
MEVAVGGGVFVGRVGIVSTGSVSVETGVVVHAAKNNNPTIMMT